MKKYTKIAKLGKGTFGDVILAKKEDEENENLYAIKRMNFADIVLDELPKTEAGIMMNLSHPNIIYIKEFFEENDEFYIVMEYADHKDLWNQVREFSLKNDLIPENIILNWFVQILLAIKYLHDRNILHRDIKLQNVFLTKRGLVKLGDFGVSKTLENKAAMAHTCLGTPYYLPPELCKGEAYNHKADIWMLGCLLYELCQLEKPFSGNSINIVITNIQNENPKPISKDYSPFIHELIQKLLEKSPEKRPSIDDILKFKQIDKEIKLLSEKFPEYPLKDDYILSLLETSQNFEVSRSFSTNDAYDESKYSNLNRLCNISENSILSLIERKKKLSGQKISEELIGKKLGLEMQESCNFSPNLQKTEEKSQTPKKLGMNTLNKIQIDLPKVDLNISFEERKDNSALSKKHKNSTEGKSPKKVLFENMLEENLKKNDRAILFEDFLRNKFPNYDKIKELFENENIEEVIPSEKMNKLKELIGNENDLKNILPMIKIITSVKNKMENSSSFSSSMNLK